MPGSCVAESSSTRAQINSAQLQMSFYDRGAGGRSFSREPGRCIYATLAAKERNRKKLDHRSKKEEEKVNIAKKRKKIQLG